ncbi:D-lyxose/D-mannose family sugar isomerase [Sporanaerobium hydrogeniformans]|uniref:D-lyxose/D-mannose family sugar isomerase n=1 Tax=Sporanaerobium hydrogeniformans TaxID=3072179 RepID=A0AC61DBE9_9FIRM|nr:D-lyxose/D-mannose family sugar isomerase [Sporanaerobium hydrogeniformans]PHV70061.1 D-lyxose/D-mannose family sugar isomerase [Sporanaerobium hydrogeniformans]
MKRSEINKALKEMESMLKMQQIYLPAFCHFTPEEWKEKGNEYNEIRDNMLGWDITDFGLGKFDEVGFSLITLRNGNVKDNKYKKPYAEKLLYMREGQTAPMHFHWNKMEDIINKGGGNVYIRVYNADEEGDLSDKPVSISCDGKEQTVPAGTQVLLRPGESICIPPYMYHDFALQEGTGPVLLGEVSMCNDDQTDNRFYEKIGRFPQIEEDERPYRLLCNEYPLAK